MQIIGLEEWYSNSKNYLTTIRCSSATGEIQDPAYIEHFKNIFFDDKYIQ